MLNFGLSMGKSGGKLNSPSWWKISTLSTVDIIDAWDFGWIGHTDTVDMPVGFEHGNTFVNRVGNPSYRLGDGIYVGGAGAIDVPTTGLDWNEVSVIMEVSGCTQNGTLDAIFSHYLPDGYFVLQNDFPDGELRWTCGHPDTSSTIEIAGALTPTGIVGVSGPILYKDGIKIGEVPGTTSAPVDTDFIIGCITTDGINNTQFMRGTIKKVLIVRRRLTDAEHEEITLNMMKCTKPEGQYLDNWTFDCGILGWTHNPSYPATITDNGDGSIHLAADTNYGSVSPYKVPTDDTEWILEVKVKNQTGTKGGKLSIQRPNNQWDTVYFGSIADGVYQNTYTGVIKRIDVGANNEVGFEMDLEYLSLRRTDSKIVTYEGDTVTYNGSVVTHG